MWENTRSLTLAANCLFVLAALLAVSYALRALVISPAFPLHAIRVEGDLAQVQRAQIVNTLEGRVRGTFFTVDLEALRRHFEAIPWVRRAAVRRVWPDRIEVRIEERVALARWGHPGDRMLLDRNGELFVAESDAALPLLAGPAGSEREVALRYAAFSRLLAPLSLAPDQVILTPRYAWRLHLDNGITLELGRDRGADTVESRLLRFAQAYPGTIARLARAPGGGAQLGDRQGDRQGDPRTELRGESRGELRVDMRYPSGFALRLPQAQHERQAQRERQAGAGRPRA